VAVGVLVGGGDVLVAVGGFVGAASTGRTVGEGIVVGEAVAVRGTLVAVGVVTTTRPRRGRGTAVSAGGNAGAS